MPIDAQLLDALDTFDAVRGPAQPVDHSNLIAAATTPITFDDSELTQIRDSPGFDPNERLMAATEWDRRFRTGEGMSPSAKHERLQEQKRAGAFRYSVGLLPFGGHAYRAMDSLAQRQISDRIKENTATSEDYLRLASMINDQRDYAATQEQLNDGSASGYLTQGLDTAAHAVPLGIEMWLTAGLAGPVEAALPGLVGKAAGYGIQGLATGQALESAAQRYASGETPIRSAARGATDAAIETASERFFRTPAPAKGIGRAAMAAASLANPFEEIAEELIAGTASGTAAYAFGDRGEKLEREFGPAGQLAVGAATGDAKKFGEGVKELGKAGMASAILGGAASAVDIASERAPMMGAEAADYLQQFSNEERWRAQESTAHRLDEVWSAPESAKSVVDRLLQAGKAPNEIRNLAQNPTSANFEAFGLGTRRELTVPGSEARKAFGQNAKTYIDFLAPGQAPTQSPPTAAAGFTTAQGSTYEIDERGRTTRTKSQHIGHDPNDVGEKRPSERTFYIDPEDARRVGMWGSSSAGGKRIIVRGDEAVLVSINPQTGKHGQDERIKLHRQPAVGLSPLELWGKNRKGWWRENHPGSPITEIRKRGAASPQRTTPPPQSQQSAPAAAGHTVELEAPSAAEPVSQVNVRSYEIELAPPQQRRPVEEILPAPAPAPDATGINMGEVQQPAQPVVDDVARGIEKLQSYYEKEIDRVEPQTPEEADAHHFLKQSGYTPVFIRARDGSKLPARGSFQGRAVFIRSGQKGTALWEAVGHETAHASGLDVTSQADAEIINAAAERYMAKASERYRQRMQADPELWRREGVAQLVGEFMQDADFRDQLQQQNPSLWQRIRDAILSVLGKFTPRDKAMREAIAALRQTAAPAATQTQTGAIPAVGDRVAYRDRSTGQRTTGTVRDVDNRTKRAGVDVDPVPGQMKAVGHPFFADLEIIEKAGKSPERSPQSQSEDQGNGTSLAPGILESPGTTQGEQPGVSGGTAAGEQTGAAPANDRGSVLPSRAAGEGSPSKSQPGRGRGDRQRVRREPARAEPTSESNEREGASPAGGVRVPDGGRGRSVKLDSDLRLTPQTVTAEGGPVGRIKSNLAAIKLLKQLEAEKREATPAEQATLVKYVGWGGLSQAVDARWGDAMIEDRSYGRNAEWESKWGKHFREIRAALTDEEFETAERSTLNAHFTSLPIVHSIWEAVGRLGFAGGTVLEPAAGVGHFFGLMPQALHEQSRKIGVELDSLSARITAKLYPSAKVINKPFQDSGIPANSVDLAISNVPFSDEKVSEGQEFYGQDFNLHNFFLAHMLNAVRPGGMVVAITTSNTMQSAIKQREWLAEHAELVGAIRLPNTAFKENAGTEVTTDILFLRKPMSGLRHGGEQWRSLREVDTPDGPARVNEYFLAHPEMVLGKHSMAGKMYARQSDKAEYTVLPDTSRPLADQLRDAIAKLPAGSFGQGSVEQVDFSKLGEAGDAADGTLIIRNGVVAAVQGKQFVDPAKLFPKPPKQLQEQLEKYVAIREHYREHIALMASRDPTKEQVEESRKRLNRLYDRYHKAHGPLNGYRAKWVKGDPGFDVVAGLERREDNGGERAKDHDWKKAEIFDKRTIFPVVEPTSAADLSDALKVSLAFRGQIDIGYVASLLGQDREALEEQLHADQSAFQNPDSGTWEPKDRYLSGNVRKKLDIARAADLRATDDRYKRNVAALEKVQPAPQSIENISFRLGATWIPDTVYSQWATKAFGTKVDVTYIEVTDTWKVAAGAVTPKMTQAGFGTQDVRADKLLEKALNLRSARITKEIGEGKRAFDPIASAAANAAIEKMSADFIRTVKGSEAASQLLEDAYNTQFNGFVNWKPSGAHLTLPGINEAIKLRPYQRDAIWRFVVDGTGLLAHAVGAGKTYTLIASAMEMRRLGVARRPMIVVQNSTLSQFAAQAKQLYPGGRILVADKDKMAGANRRRFLSSLVSSDWDLVVIGHSQFESLRVSPEFEEKFTDDLLQQLEDAISDDVARGGRKNDPTQKELIKEKKKLEAKLAALREAAKQMEDTISFSDLNIDALFIDEAHRYKKPPFVTKLENMVGLNKQAGATSTATMMKVREIQSRNNGRGVFFSTGTPITNTLGEAWHVVNFLNPKLLEEMGIQTFDRFVSSFVVKEQIPTMNAGGAWVTKTALKRFTNYREFYNLIAGAFDTVTPDQVQAEVRAEGKPFPELRGGRRQIVKLPLSNPVAKINAFLQRAYTKYQKLTRDQKDEWKGLPVVLYGVGKVAAIDARLIDPEQPDDPGSKTNAVAANVATIYQQTAATKGTQLVFVDQIRPFKMDIIYKFMEGEAAIFDADEAAEVEPEEQADSKQNLWLYEQLKKKLVAAGVPQSEIAFIHDAKDDKQREKLYAAVNAGDIRVLIGGTQKMGVGVNVQKRLYALHHTDCPWMPSDLEQREGRILRFGNTNPEVEILTYGMERTIEANVFNTVARKAKSIWQAMAGNIAENEFEDPASETSVSAEEAMALLSGDPLVFEKIRLESDVRRLRIEKMGWEDGQSYARRKVREYKEEQKRLQDQAIPAQQKLIKEAGAIDKAKFTAKLVNQTYDDRGEFGKAFDAEIEKQEAAFRRTPEAAIPTSAAALRNGQGSILLTFSLFGDVRGEVRIGSENVIRFEEGQHATKKETHYLTTLYIGDRAVYSSEAKSGSAAVQNVLSLPEKLATGLERMQSSLAETEKFIAEYTRSLDQPFESDGDLQVMETRLAEVEKALLAPKAAQKESDTEDQPPEVEAAGFGLGGGTVLVEKVWADRLGAKVEEVRDLLPDDEAQANRIANAYGAKRPTFTETVRNVMVEFGKLFRVNKHLAKTAENAVANEFIRLLPEIPRAAMDETARTVAAIVKPLGPKQVALFSFVLAARNLKANFAENKLHPEHPLPKRFGMDEKAVDDWLKKLERLAENTPEVQKALARRKLVLDGLVERLVAADLLPAEAKDRTETYFHQQVLSYLAAKSKLAGGAQAQLSKHGYRRARTRGVDELGEQFDFNTFFIEAETEWMAKAIGDLTKAERLDLLTKRYDKMGNFVRLAADRNFEKLVGGPDNVRRILALRRQIARMEAGDDKTALMEERNKLDPTQPFRTRIAKAMSGLRKHIKSMIAPRTIETLEMTEYFGKVKELASGPEDAPQTIAARTLLKAVADRRAFLKERLGASFETWQSLLRKSPEYKIWQPRPGHYFYRALSVPAMIAEQVQAGLLDRVQVSAEDLVPILAMGSMRDPVIFPAAVVDQLEEIHVEKSRVPSVVETMAKAPLKYLKLAWLYYKPTNFLAYFARNTFGDLEPAIASMSPGMLAYIPRAGIELGRYYLARRERGGREELSTSPQLSLARDLGVIAASMDAQEVPHLDALGPFRRFYKPDGDSGARWVLDNIERFRDFHEFFEQVRRYAAYLYFREKLAKDDVHHYGAANKTIVDTLRREWNDDVAAAHLARELMGDYGNVTIVGRYLRDYLMPFWSWTEINLKRWPRIALNTYDWADRKADGNKAAKAMYLAAGAMAYGSALTGLFFWNNVIIPFLLGGDPEDELSDVDRNTAHLLLPWRYEDGSYPIFRNPTASGEFMKFFGLNTLSNLFPLWQEGKITTGDLAREWAWGQVATGWAMMRPEIKVPGELMMGATTYPDPSAPRAMPRDEILANIPGWRDEYMAAKGAVLQEGHRARPHYWPKLWGISVTDPKENALSEIHDLRTRYLHKLGNEPTNPLRVSDTRVMKQAARADDFEAFQEAKKVYVRSGKTFKTFKASIDRLDPLETQLNEEQEREFIDKFLNAADRRKLTVARDYAADLRSRMAAWWHLAK